VIIVLAEAPLETIPEEIRHHPAIISDARRRGKDPSKLILDKSRHWPAMKRLRDAHRRGRPDIVFDVLKIVQGSILNAVRLTSLVVHTVGGKAIYVARRMRPPQNYLNFLGLFEQLLERGSIPPDEKPLAVVFDKSLRTLLSELGGEWVTMHEGGRRLRLVDAAKLVMGRVVVVGGFPHGDFQNRWVIDEALDVVAIAGGAALTAPQVVERLIVAAEITLGLI